MPCRQMPFTYVALTEEARPVQFAEMKRGVEKRGLKRLANNKTTTNNDTDNKETITNTTTTTTNNNNNNDSSPKSSGRMRPSPPLPESPPR